MPLNVLDIRSVVAKGVSSVCATCSRFWKGRDVGLPFPSCTAERPCGGPIAGLDFPEYDGPLTEFDRFCFVCGGTGVYGVKIPNRTKVIGMCRPHLSLLDRLCVEDEGTSPIEVHSAKGIIIPIGGRLTRRTLVEEIYETELQFEAERKAKNG